MSSGGTSCPLQNFSAVLAFVFAPVVVATFDDEASPSSCPASCPHAQEKDVTRRHNIYIYILFVLLWQIQARISIDVTLMNAQLLLPRLLLLLLLLCCCCAAVAAVLLFLPLLPLLHTCLFSCSETSTKRGGLLVALKMTVHLLMRMKDRAMKYCSTQQKWAPTGGTTSPTKGTTGPGTTACRRLFC